MAVARSLLIKSVDQLGNNYQKTIRKYEYAN